MDGATDEVDEVAVLVAGATDANPSLDAVGAVRRRFEQVDQGAGRDRTAERDRGGARVVVVFVTSVLVVFSVLGAVCGLLPHQRRDRKFVGGVFVARGVEDEGGVDAPAPSDGEGGTGVPLVHAISDARDHRAARVRLDHVRLGDDGERRGGVAGGRLGKDVDGAEVFDGVYEVDDAAGSHVLRAAVANQSRETHGIGGAARLDDDRVKSQTGLGEAIQGIVEPSGIGKTAEASAGDGRRLVDLSRDESGVDVQRAEVVDHDADPRAGAAQQVIQERRLPGAEVPGESDHGNARRAVVAHGRRLSARLDTAHHASARSAGRQVRNILNNDTRIVRVSDAPRAALALTERELAREAPPPLVDVAPPDPAVVARAVLARSLDADRGVSAWVALAPDGTARALVASALEVADETHPTYTYLPERYAIVPAPSWHVAAVDDLALLPELVRRIGEDAGLLGIRRLVVHLRADAWAAGSAWRQLGLLPDAVWAFWRGVGASPGAPARGVTVRVAEPRDEDAMVALSFEEYRYHADHTRTGTRTDQVEAPTRAIVRAAITGTSPGADGASGAFVAESDGRVLGCLSWEVIELPATSSARFHTPARYGYIGLTSVTAAERGRGIGRALAARALDEFSRMGVRDVSLHYIDDNPLSRTFWNRLGFAPHIVTLAGDVWAQR